MSHQTGGPLDFVICMRKKSSLHPGKTRCKQPLSAMVFGDSNIIHPRQLLPRVEHWLEHLLSQGSGGGGGQGCDDSLHYSQPSGLFTADDHVADSEMDFILLEFYEGSPLRTSACGRKGMGR